MIVNVNVKSHCYHLYFTDGVELEVWAKNKEVLMSYLSDLGKASLREVKEG